MNPFLLTGYIGPDYFCDREEETETLTGNILNNSNTAFFAPRRIGKTVLIQHVFHHLQKKKIICIYTDIFATQNLKEFTNIVATSVYNSIPQNSSWGKKILEAFKLLRPVISMDELSGNPQLTLDISQKKQIEKTIPQLFELLDKQNIRIVIAIDEFQQILAYPEKNVEALLRSSIQQLKNIHFIFCGSNQKMIHEIFNSSKRPFYASTKNINLKKIDRTKYAAFIRRHFKNSGRKINAEAVEYILNATDTHTYYTQRLCHEIVQLNEKEINHETILRALYKIMNDNESGYFQYRKLLTLPQWQLLKAIAREEKVERPYNKDFIYNYQLGTPSGVKRALESLLEKEMIYHEINTEKPYYEVYDKFLMKWLQIK